MWELKHSTQRKRNKTSGETQKVPPSPLGGGNTSTMRKKNTYKHVFKDMGNSIWLRLLLLLSEKSTCFICMRGLQTEEEVEQGRGRQGRPKLSWNRRGAKQRQSWNRSGRNSDACEARFDKFVKIAAATVTEESAEERAKGKK